MTVIVVAACPVGLRGHLTRWLLEISAGVFVGKISARVRDLLWERTLEMVKNGRAIMVYSANNEQGLAFKVHRHEWTPIEIEGLTLMLRPNNQLETPQAGSSDRTQGWSSASRRRRFRNR
ncbi:MAG: type I-E CRISPR-associated endoribonuclease Cas2e [Pseudonocardia sp.]|nr:type I-E CRISPR-associated endoribonuclease Cas2e [Pseudonocardia sp.]